MNHRCHFVVAAGDSGKNNRPSVHRSSSWSWNFAVIKKGEQLGEVLCWVLSGARIPAVVGRRYSRRTYTSFVDWVYAAMYIHTRVHRAVRTVPVYAGAVYFGILSIQKKQIIIFLLSEEKERL